MTGILDRLAVRETLDSYSNALNRRAWDDLAALFAEDAVWTVLNVREKGADNSRTGRDNIAGAIAAVIDAYPMFLQMTGACQVMVEGDSATASVAIKEFARGEDGNGVMLVGMYFDKLARVGDRWLFTYREFHPYYINRGVLPGEHFPPHDPARAHALGTADA